jgi:hypothetical protein
MAAGVIKDMVMLGGYQEVEFDFFTDKQERTLYPLSPAAAYGFRFYDALQLRMTMPGACK